MGGVCVASFRFQAPVQCGYCIALGTPRQMRFGVNLGKMAERQRLAYVRVNTMADSALSAKRSIRYTAVFGARPFRTSLSAKHLGARWHR